MCNYRDKTRGPTREVGGPIRTPGSAGAGTHCRGAATSVERRSCSSQLRYTPYAHSSASVSQQDRPLGSPQDAEPARGTGAPATGVCWGGNPTLTHSAFAGEAILGLNQGKFSRSS